MRITILKIIFFVTLISFVIVGCGGSRFGNYYGTYCLATDSTNCSSSQLTIGTGCDDQKDLTWQGQLRGFYLQPGSCTEVK